jgi:hypothetical protein
MPSISFNGSVSFTDIVGRFLPIKTMNMKKKLNNEQTSSHVATIAGCLLRNSKTTKQVKSLAASALTQVRERRRVIEIRNKE